ncbi:hypothetical protein E2986_10688 [Frieseomelitta varia]|uniref:Ig-like domain-containing protein n=1 Tax=Frieseomelitta varia TaxID=561572 RepID=A0A833RZZ8_9HYME|nr:hypothetical protein E2986_10688 [Frieseomelitta varia]
MRRVFTQLHYLHYFQQLLFEVAHNWTNAIAIFRKYHGRFKRPGRPAYGAANKRDTHHSTFILHFVAVGEGSVLKLTRVTRSDMGPYLCIASNGVPPAVSKRIVLNVYYILDLFAKNQGDCSEVLGFQNY